MIYYKYYRKMIADVRRYKGAVSLHHSTFQYSWEEYNWVYTEDITRPDKLVYMDFFKR